MTASVAFERRSLQCVVLIDSSRQQAPRLVTHGVDPLPRARRPAPRSRLLAVAARLFAEAGVQAVSVATLIEAADVSRPTLYRYFDSKDHLVLACIAQETARTFEALDEVMSAAGDAPSQIHAAALFFAGQAGPRHRLLALDIALEFPDPAHPVRRAAMQAVRLLTTRLAARLKTLDAEASAAHLTLLILGAGPAGLAMGRDAAGHDLVEAVSAFLAVLERRSATVPDVVRARSGGLLATA